MVSSIYLKFLLLCTVTLKKDALISCFPGKKLRTVSLIPPTMYGEGDKLIALMLQYAEDNNGSFIRMGNGENLEAYAYAGNVAWGFICCLKTMYNNPSFGNERMFIMDDTPPQ